MPENQILSAKREIERAHFENFLRLGSERVDSFGLGDPPEPDIWATQEGALIGVEITEYYRRAAKRHEAEEDGVIERASRIYQSLEGPFVDVGVMWAPHFTIAKTNRGELARRIADVVRANTPPLGGATTLEWKQLGPELRNAVNHIHINRLIAYSRDYWHAARGGGVPQWDPEELQAEIDRKNSKPRKYIRQYVDTWLLIVSAFGSPAAWMEVTEQVRTHEFQSSFGRVFVLSSFPLEVLELKVAGQPIK